VTATSRGRDDLSETKGSLPSHSRSGRPAGRLRAAGQVEVQGRAADEAAARRTMTGLPFSGCESGRLREAPTRNQEPSGWRNRIRWDTGPSGSGPARAESGTSVCAPPPAEKGFGPDRSGRTGLRPGGCEPADPAFRRMAVRRNQGLRPEDPAGCGTEASAEGPRRQERERELSIRQAANRQGFGPVGEPAGKPDPASAGDGPRRERWMSPRLIHPFSKPPGAWNASPPRLGSNAKGQWGPAAMPAPINLCGRWLPPAPLAIPTRKYAQSLRRRPG
jgi:hypothetical protein